MKYSVAKRFLFFVLSACVLLAWSSHAAADEACSFWKFNGVKSEGEMLYSWNPPAKSETCTKLIAEDLDITVDMVSATDGSLLKAGEKGLVVLRIANKSRYEMRLVFIEEFFSQYNLRFSEVPFKSSYKMGRVSTEELLSQNDSGPSKMPSFFATVKYTFLDGSGNIVSEENTITGSPGLLYVFPQEENFIVFVITAPEKKGVYDIRISIDNVAVKDAVVDGFKAVRYPVTTDSENLVDVYFQKEVSVKGVSVK